MVSASSLQIKMTVVVGLVVIKLEKLSFGENSNSYKPLEDTSKQISNMESYLTIKPTSNFGCFERRFVDN